jgi:hypothetical protein
VSGSAGRTRSKASSSTGRRTRSGSQTSPPSSVADCAAFPFLKYGLIWDEDDDHLFHRILVDYLRLEGTHPRLEAWIRRMDERPRV